MKKTAFFLVGLLGGLWALGQNPYYLFVGTYTNTGSKGIYVYKFENGKITGPVSDSKISNPSYLAISADEKYVYAVEEDADNNDGGYAVAYRFDKKSGQLTLLNRQKTHGDHPCYIEVDQTGKWVFAGNYSSGNFSVFPVNADGSLGTASQTIGHEGKSINTDRQEKPHVHCTELSPDNKWLFVPDLGIDKVMIYSFNASTGQLTGSGQSSMSSMPGAGPRHITFHPNKKNAYLIEELTGTVQVYKYKDGKLKHLQSVSSLPTHATGFAGSADIHVSADGKFLYASNRGDFDNIAIYKIDKKGTLTVVGFQPTLGKAPRNFSIDPSGNYLLAANQNTDEVVIFNRDRQTGRLTDTGQRIKIPRPVCLKWIKAE